MKVFSEVLGQSTFKYSADSVTLLHCRNLWAKSGQQRSRMTSKLRPALSGPAVNLRIPLSCDKVFACV